MKGVLLSQFIREKVARIFHKTRPQLRRGSLVWLATFILIVGISVFGTVTFSSLAQAATSNFNQEINYQAKLTDDAGVAVVDGDYDITFALYTAASGGSAIWTEAHTGGAAVETSNGLFSIMLGSITPFTGVNFNQPLYLGVTIAGDSEMTPRKVIGSVPSALVADSLDGLDSSDFISTSTTALPNVTTMVGLATVGADSATTTFLGNIATAGTTIIQGFLTSYNRITAPYFTATSTTVASTFPYASTTALTVSGTAYLGSLTGLLYGNAGAVGTIATSSLGLSTTDIVEGSNLYYTDARVGSYIVASTTLPTFLNYWTLTGSDLGYASGNVGIGTSSPYAALSVVGDSVVTGTSTVRQGLIVGNDNPSVNLDIGAILASSINFSASSSVTHEDTDIIFSDETVGAKTLSQLLVNPSVCTQNNAVLSGGVVTYSGLGFIFDVSPTTYCIGGLLYQAPATQITLTDADTASDRIDMVVVNTSSVATFVTGTPSDSPSAPSINPTSQLSLTIVFIGANSTQPGDTGTGPVQEKIYLENVEWVGSQTTPVGEVSFSSAANPQAGSTNVEVTTPLRSGDFFQFSSSTATWNPSGFSTLSFYIRLKSVFTANNDRLVITLRSNTGAQLGSAVVVQNNTYGFDRTNVSSYQKIAIPLSAFGAVGTAVKTVRFAVPGANALNFRIDTLVAEGTTQGTATTLTTGSVIFAGTGGALAEDTNNFVWNNTFKRLGIGTSSPYAALSVVGEVVSSFFTATSTTASSSFQRLNSTGIAVTGQTAGCAQFLAGGFLTSTGAVCASNAGTPFTFSTNFSQTMAATSSPIWAQGGLYASSTSYLSTTTVTTVGGTNSASLTFGSQFTGALGDMATIFARAGGVFDGYGLNIDANNIFVTPGSGLTEVTGIALANSALDKSWGFSFDPTIGDSGKAFTTGFNGSLIINDQSQSIANDAAFGVYGTTTDDTAWNTKWWDSSSNFLGGIRNDGSFSIGSSSPRSKLTVDDGATFMGATFFATTTIGGGGRSLEIGSSEGLGLSFPNIKPSLASGVDLRLGILTGQWYAKEDPTAAAGAGSAPILGLISDDLSVSAVLSMATTTGDVEFTGNGSFYFNNAGGVKMSTLAGSGVRCLQTDNDGLISGTALPCGSGGGGGTDVNWTFFNGSGIQVSTTSNQVLIGGTGTTSLADLEVQGDTYLTGTLGIGTTTPGSTLSLGNTGNNTINISTTATSTFGSGINIRTGCFAVNGVCVGNSNGAAYDWQKETNFGAPALTPTTTLSIWSKSDIYASSSIYASSNITAGGSITGSTLTATSTTASSSLQNTSVNQLKIGTLSGLLKASTGFITAATAGTDYLVNAVTSIGPTGQTQTGSAVTLATSTSATNGLTSALTIVGSGNTLTFTPSVSGTLTVGGGGTGLSSTPTYGQLLVGNGSGYTLTATSSLGIAISDTTGTLAIARGGTGVSSYTGAGTNRLLYLNSSNVFAPIAGANNSILRTDGSGVPSLSTTLPALSLGGQIDGGSTYDIVNLSGLTVTGTVATSTFSTGGLTVGTSQFVVQQNSGNVGIGTTTPRGKLDVFSSQVTNSSFFSDTTLNLEKSGNNGINIVSSTGGYGIMRFSDGAGSPGTIKYDHSGDYLSLNTNFSERLRIDSSGNLGIGDTSPLSALTVGDSDAFQVDSTGRVFANAGASGAGNLAYSFVGDTDTGLYRSSANQIRLQTSGLDRVVVTSGGEVMIGTTTAISAPALGDARLSVSYGGHSVLAIGTETAGNAAQVYLSRPGGQEAFIGYSTANDFDIYTNGNADMRFLTLTTSSVASERMKIEADGSIMFSSAMGTGTGGNYLCINTTTYEVLRGNGSACTSSSLKFKEDIEELTYGLEAVLELRPVSYKYKEETNMGEGTKLGFIAEEMEKVIPEIVTYDEEGEVFGLDYPLLVSVLTKAIQELADSLKDLTGDTLTYIQGTFDSLTTEEIKTNKLCVGNTCVTEQEFIRLLDQSNTSEGSNDSNSNDSEDDPDEPADEGGEGIIPGDEEVELADQEDDLSPLEEENVEDDDDTSPEPETSGDSGSSVVE